MNSGYPSGVYRKIAWRLIPFMLICYISAQLSRFNISFAKIKFIDDISEDELKIMVMEELEAMSFSGELEDGSRGKYRLFPVENFVTGKIDVTSNGNAYVINENFEEDIFIAKGSTLNALKGDIVKVSLYAKKKGQRNEGEVVEVVERARSEFAGIDRKSTRLNSSH